MPREYALPDKKIAWQRVVKALTIYSRAPGVNIERINTFLREEGQLHEYTDYDDVETDDPRYYEENGQ